MSSLEKFINTVEISLNAYGGVNLYSENDTIENTDVAIWLETILSGTVRMGSATTDNDVGKYILSKNNTTEKVYELVGTEYAHPHYLTVRFDEAYHEYMASLEALTKSEELETLLKFTEAHNVSVQFNPIGGIVITKDDGSVCSVSTSIFNKLIHDSFDLNFLKFENYELQNAEGNSSNDIFKIASKYDLEITIQSDGGLNVFDGTTERQSPMTLDELNEYVKYLELRNKYSEMMK